ncbi:MAG: hypothetical protein K8L99_30995 [Anaerolineae bacterium]|nr:hypothetical protein [Anaerolineae bacterium]
MNTAARLRFIEWLRQRAQIYLRDWRKPEPFDWRATLVILGGAVLLLPLTQRLPLLAFEWYLHTWGEYDQGYPPWLQLSIKPLTIWPQHTGASLLQGILLMSVAVAVLKAASSYPLRSKLGAVALALCSAPVLMLLWEGNLTILTLFGLVALPFGAPYALLQPHLTSWALLARRSWMLWGLALAVISLLIWGFWPEVLWARKETQGLAAQLAMGWLPLGWPLLVIGLLMLPFTNADPLRLMAVGAFCAPYMLSAHLVLLLPAIGRVGGRKRLLLWLLSWLTLLPPMFIDNIAKYPVMLFPLAVWWLLRPDQST